MPLGTLYLIPVPLGDSSLAIILPQGVREIAAKLDTFIVEHPKTARAFLKQVDTRTPLQQINLLVLDEHTLVADLPALLDPLRAGKDIGLISEAGCPAVADPGSNLVRFAHQEGIRVVPLVGPSSILLALMASGLSLSYPVGTIGRLFPLHHSRCAHAHQLEGVSHDGVLRDPPIDRSTAIRPSVALTACYPWHRRNRTPTLEATRVACPLRHERVPHSGLARQRRDASPGRKGAW